MLVEKALGGVAFQQNLDVPLDLGVLKGQKLVLHKSSFDVFRTVFGLNLGLFTALPSFLNLTLKVRQT